MINTDRGDQKMSRNIRMGLRLNRRLEPTRLNKLDGWEDSIEDIIAVAAQQFNIRVIWQERRFILMGEESSKTEDGENRRRRRCIRLSMILKFCSGEWKFILGVEMSEHQTRKSLICERFMNH